MRFIPIHDDGTLDLDAAATLMNLKSKVLAFTHVSNVTGVFNLVAELTALAHNAGALVVLDACKSAPHLPLDVKALDVDFAVFSGHKMLAPTCIDGVYGLTELLDAMPPFLTGGSMITTVTMDEAGYLPSAQRFEAGTQPISQAAALAAFKVVGMHGHDVGQFLDAAGTAVRVGHHCAPPLHRELGLNSCTRASAYLYNTTTEVDAFLTAVTLPSTSWTGQACR